MTDDQTRPVITQPGSEPPTGGEPPAGGMTLATEGTAAGPAPTTSVAVGAPDGSNRTRWAIALAIAGGAIAVAIAGFLLLAGRPAPEALRYIPSNSAAVIEARFELPGDQLQKLGNLLAHFPGFQDQANLPDKIDEALSRLVTAASEGGVDYRGDLKPWVSGPLFVGIGAPEGAADGSQTPSTILVSATTNGAVGCAEVLEGQTVQRETYRGLEIQSVSGGDLPSGDLACVVDGRQVLVGDPASVKAGLDAKAESSGVDRTDRYRAARGSLAGDQLATIFVSGAALDDLVSGPLPSLGADVPGLGSLEVFGSAVPEWMIAGLRAEDDALVIDTAVAPAPASTNGPSLLPLPATHPGVIAAMAPPNTVLLIEDQGTGVNIQNALARVKDIPDLAEPLAMLNGLGGADDLVGWVTDLGIVVTGGDSPGGGLLLFAADDAAATERYRTLTGLFGLLGLGGGVEIRQSTISGVAVTTVVIADPGSLVPPDSVPGDVEIPDVGPIEISIAARGRAVILGSGEGLMTTLLGVQPGASLADQDAYKRAAARALPSSRTTIYVGVPEALALVEGHIPAEELAQWQADVAPYVDPLESVAMSLTTDASTGRSRLVITVRQP